MTDVNRHRGFRLEDDIELPLLIKATHLPHPSRLNRYSAATRMRMPKIVYSFISLGYNVFMSTLLQYLTNNF